MSTDTIDKKREAAEIAAWVNDTITPPGCQSAWHRGFNAGYEAAGPELEAARQEVARLTSQIPNAAYCDMCGKTQPLVDEEMRKDDLNEYPWRDLTCSVCKLVINSVSRIEPRSIGSSANAG